MHSSPSDPSGSFRAWSAAQTRPAVRAEDWTPAINLYRDYQGHAEACGIAPSARIDLATFGEELRTLCGREPRRQMARVYGRSQLQIADCWPRAIRRPVQADRPLDEAPARPARRRSSAHAAIIRAIVAGALIACATPHAAEARSLGERLDDLPDEAWGTVGGFAADGLVSHIIIHKGGQEKGWIARKTIGRSPSAAKIVGFNIAKSIGYLAGISLLQDVNAGAARHAARVTLGLQAGVVGYNVGVVLKVKI